MDEFLQIFGSLLLNIIKGDSQEYNKLSEMCSVRLTGEPGTFLYDNINKLGGESLLIKIFNKSLDRKEMIKIARPELVKKTRFVRGARIQGKLARRLRRNIPCVYELCENPCLYAMEFINGKEIYEWALGSNNYAVWKLFLKILDFFTILHEYNFVHRDIKPENIMVAKDPHLGEFEPWILDWGLTKHLDDPNDNLTQTGAQLYTPAYACQEQKQNPKNPKFDWDIFSLGRVLHVCFCRRLPTKKNDFPEKLLPGGTIRPIYLAAINKEFKTTVAFKNALEAIQFDPAEKLEGASAGLFHENEKEDLEENDDSKVMKVENPSQIEEIQPIEIPPEEPIEEVQKKEIEFENKFLNEFVKFIHKVEDLRK